MVIPHMTLAVFLLFLSFSGFTMAIVGFCFLGSRVVYSKVLGVLTITVGLLTEVWSVLTFDVASLPLITIVFAPTVILGIGLTLLARNFKDPIRRGFPIDLNDGDKK